MILQAFLPNFWKVTIIKAVAFGSIFHFDRHFLTERKDIIAEKLLPQAWTPNLLWFEVITHEFWNFSSRNKQRWDKNMLSWYNQNLGVCCSSSF
jgi:hypothetical protein